MKGNPEKLRAWVETLEAIQGKLPSDISYYHLEQYGEIRDFLNLLLKQSESGGQHD